MGTKTKPGKHDCYAKAGPTEPLFTLLARDPLAPDAVELWARMAELTGEDPGKVQEARDCARDMRYWKRSIDIEAGS